MKVESNGPDHSRINRQISDCVDDGEQNGRGETAKKKNQNRRSRNHVRFDDSQHLMDEELSRNRATGDNADLDVPVSTHEELKAQLRREISEKEVLRRKIDRLRYMVQLKFSSVPGQPNGITQRPAETLLTSPKTRTAGVCFSCGTVGHFAKDYSQPKKRNGNYHRHAIHAEENSHIGPRDETDTLTGMLHTAYHGSLKIQSERNSDPGLAGHEDPDERSQSDCKSDDGEKGFFWWAGRS